MPHRSPVLGFILLLTISAASLCSTSRAADVAGGIPIPFTPDRWTVQGDARFLKREGFPYGLLTLNGDSSKEFAALKGFSFANGTIEFDVKAIGEDMPGLRFRQRDAKTAEEFYMRVEPDCPAAQDCLQYAPVMHGRMLWDTYIRYQASAPFIESQWNHVKLVVAGRRMKVYINRQSAPSLSVGHLEGDALAGGLQLQGPATFANLVVTPEATEHLASAPAPDPSAHDRRFLRAWRYAQPVQLAEGGTPDIADLSARPAVWTSIHAEDNGLINLARRFDAHGKGDMPPLIVWLKTDLQSDRDQTKHVSIGFLREVWVFVNGKSVYVGRNLYNTPAQRKAPDGRISLENGSFDMPLRKGTNSVVVAIRSNTPDMSDKYGWGVELRLDNLEGGIRLP